MTRPIVILVSALLLLGACDNIEKAKPRPQSARLDGAALGLEMPQIMRGTVGGDATILGYNDVVVRGYGLVVGLNGTGSRNVPAEVRAYMVREMGKRGVGLPPFDEFTPDELLDSLDTAVVVAEGVIPAGAPKGTAFDVRVYSAPGTSTTSLEGGRLYSAELRPGVLTAGNRQAFALATAKGPVFVNPYADPGRSARLSGRILEGGTTSKDMPLKLRLFTPSHNRAMTIQSAVNSTFPREPGQTDNTCRGESGSALLITVPPSYRERTREFIELLQHTSLSLEAPEAIATQIRRLVLATPAYSDDASWRWQSLGVRVQPVIRELYDYPEERPRMAALRAGARLNDPLVVPELTQMTESSSTETRLEAITLLGDMGFNPSVDMALRRLLDDPDIDVRLAAYESLLERNDPSLRRFEVGRKFEMVLVPSDKPLIYVSQTGAARLAIFGEQPQIELPLTFRMWANRLMAKADLGDETIEVYYRPVGSEQSIVDDAPVDLAGFVQFLAHRPTVEDPRPGLDLSYGETVGVMYELWKTRAVPCDYKSEQDRILAAILRIETESGDFEERPEFGDPDFDFLDAEGAAGTQPGDLSPIAPTTSGVPGAGSGSGGGIVPR